MKLVSTLLRVYYTVTYLGHREPGKVHCVPLPGMVRSVVATMSYSRSPCNNATIPRTQDPFAGDADVFPPPQLSTDEKAVFSR